MSHILNNVLKQEMNDFLEAGMEAGFAAPQSMAEGDYDGKYITVNGVRNIDLTRLDYLSLGQNNIIRGIMKDCIDKFDTACPCSQMAMKTGSTIKLENAISDMNRMEDSILFLSGYSTNLNIIQALGLRMRTPHLVPYIREAGLRKTSQKVKTEFFVDGETHYSLIQGMKTAKLIAPRGSSTQRYPTTDYDCLERKLKKSIQEKGEQAIRIIVTDTISSVSGKVYDLQRLCEIAEAYNCILYVDDAHGVGSMGVGGAGMASKIVDFERYRNRLIIMGTLTKAIGQLGGYVSVPDKALGVFLRAASPEYIFSAPLPPWMAEAIVQILKFVRGEYGNQERKKLQDVSLYMRESLVSEGFNILGSECQIIPIFGGEEEVSINIKNYLQSKGFTTALFECPAVPKGESIVRFSLCSDITHEEVDQIMEHLLTARKMFGL